MRLGDSLGLKWKYKCCSHGKTKENVHGLVVSSTVMCTTNEVDITGEVHRNGGNHKNEELLPIK